MRNIVRYFDGGLPINRCNLRCRYCYVSQDESIGWEQNIEEKLFYTMDHMSRALTIERLGGPCMFNFVASGEPLLFEPLTDMVTMITSLGHYARIVTNGTPFKPLERLAHLPQTNRECLTIKFSMHYLALKERGLLDSFFHNVDYIRSHGISYSVELCASDEFVSFLEEIKQMCLDRIGALPQVVELRDQTIPGYPRLTKMPLNDYRKTWKTFDSPLFNYETRDYEKHQEKFCYGGDYGITFSWQTGEASQCSCQGNKKIFNLFDHPETPLIFAAIGKNCPAMHCYTNYMWCSLVGNYDGTDVPTYEEERDRVTKDGSHWLSPVIREVYSHRCSEFHVPYSDDKEFYIDKLMQRSYQGIIPTDSEMKRLAEIVENFLSARGYQKIAIYGMGGMGNWLSGILAYTNLSVTYGIDKRGEEIKSSVSVLCPDRPLPDADVIIISIYAEYNQIVPVLKSISNADILSILELAD